MTWRLAIALILALVAAAAVSLFIGYVDVPPGTLAHALLFGDSHDVATVIAREIRLPRMALGVVVGATLGLGGAALQGLLRNPLAEPGILGVSSSAALGAVVMLYLGIAHVHPLALPAAAIAAALGSTALLLALSQRMSTLGLVLSGIAINSLTLALTTLAMSLSPNPYALSEIVYWLMGSLKDKSPTDLAITLPFVGAGAVLLAAGARGLDALTLGEDSARSLGVPVTRLRVQIVTGIALGVGACVAATGAIGFIGLVVPHLLRPLAGHRPSHLLVLSALGGALLLTLADIFVRVVPIEPELLLGVVTAFIGAPFFLYVVRRSGAQMQ